jgi:hypothetical protein
LQVDGGGARLTEIDRQRQRVQRRGERQLSDAPATRVVASCTKMQGGELASVAAKKISKVEQEWSREVLASPRNKGGDSSWPVTKKMEVGKGVLAL